MSTGLDCYFEHFTTGWYYMLERYSERDEYDAYGPFPTFKAADRHLNDHHANPDGFSLPPENGPAYEPRPDQQWIIKEATR